MALRTLYLLSCLLFSLVFCSPSHAADPIPPALMLATTYEAGIDVSEYWVSEKLDGVRGRWDGKELRTRGGHPVASPDWFTANWPEVPMDGELWMGRGRFSEVSGVVRSAEAGEQAWRQVQFMVFDLPTSSEPFGKRVLRMRVLLAQADISWLQPIAQIRVAGARELDERFNAVVAAAGEGLMLHHRLAKYELGRSEDLLKYKPYQDAEAQVIGHTGGQGKYTGMLGALIVERPDGLQFRIGSGFSDEERVKPPPLGSHVTYRYNGLTSKGVPRFARFLHIRHLLPPPDPE